jgi:hypothetical protein
MYNESEQLNGSAPSGKELARMRRAMLSTAGKSASMASVRHAVAAKQKAEMPSNENFVASSSQASNAIDLNLMASGSVREANRLRRQTMSTQGKSSTNHAKAIPLPASIYVQPLSSGESSVFDAPESDSMTMHVISSSNQHQPLAQMSAGRTIAMARRQAMAQTGKSGMQKVSKAAKVAMSMPGQDFKSALEKGVTGRQLAQLHRSESSNSGMVKSSTAVTRPTGRVRPKKIQPTKVEFTQTLSGQSVSGTRVDANNGVTGIESGECSHVTGTEYLSDEHFTQVCDSKPVAAPAKVLNMQTLSGKNVTGVDVSVSQKVTGVESGSSLTITGSEYFGTDYYQAQGVTAPKPNATKVSVMSGCNGTGVTGTNVGSNASVTGVEVGSMREISGSCYLSDGERVVGNRNPEKVIMSHTARGGQVSGSLAARSEGVTGNEAGSCKAVTGTEYLSNEEFKSFCGSDSVPLNADKVIVAKSAKNIAVTGQPQQLDVGRITGNDIGNKRRISGSQYHDVQFVSLKKAAPVATIKRQPVSLVQPASTASDLGAYTFPKFLGDSQGGNLAVTGIAVGVNENLTGSDKGICKTVTGDQPAVDNLLSAYCATHPVRVVSVTPVSGDVAFNSSKMTGNERGACSAGVTGGYISVDTPVSHRASAPVLTPDAPYASLARGRVLTGNAELESRHLTGTRGFHAQRHENPQRAMNGCMASVMKSVNHQEPVAPPIVVEPVKPVQSSVDSALITANKLTGNGSQDGHKVTGDAWASSSSVTGTEGVSSKSRNPTEKGNPKSWMVGASVYKDVEREVRVSSINITGSSSGGAKGVSVTYSGGARG